MTVYVVGEYIKEDPAGKGGVWECVGVFLFKRRAIKACIKNNYFVGPLRLGEAEYGHPLWEGAFYPSEQ